jgi:hypothetical protein
MTQAAAEAKLEAAGITARSTGGCTDKNVPTCTSYDGILSGTVDNVITLKKACACTVIITGGTEVGHASGTYSHANGYKVDFSKNTALNNYITSSFTRIEDRGDGYAQYKSAAGNIYCVSLDHPLADEPLSNSLLERGKSLGCAVLLMYRQKSNYLFDSPSQIIEYTDH